MAQHNTREGKFKTELGGIAIGAVTASFFISPFVAQGDPVLWALGGLGISLALTNFYAISVLPGNNTRFKVWFAGISGAAGLIFISFAISDSYSTLRALDRRCVKLQSEMLGVSKPAKPAVFRSPAHDTFAALKCRPQLPGLNS